jgi:formamidopyrimidine-DNA glycosylase
MPELPGVETVRRTLAPILGARIQSTWWSGKNLRLDTPIDLRALRRAGKGAQIESVRRLGKYLLLDLVERSQVIMVHLGMSGRFRHFADKSQRPAHTHVEWRLDDGRSLRYSDPRRFGNVELLERGREREHPSLARLGPDPLVDGLDDEDFHRACKRTARPIKVALLDQSLVAGVGNIYASEALFVARIHPQTPAQKLSRARCASLGAAIVEVLDRALSHGGTSLKDFVNADGHAGQHGHYLWVYDREGTSCPTSGCRSKIKRTVQQNRASFYCPRCQRR